VILILLSILAAAIFAGVGVMIRINPLHQGLWGVLAISSIPILLANAALMQYFKTAPNFTIAFFLFNGLYILAGLVAGLAIFGDKISFMGWVGVGMIVMGTILLRR